MKTLAKKQRFHKDMRGAHENRKSAEIQCRQLEEIHGSGSHYVYLGGSGSYRFQVRPTPWFKRAK